MVMLVIFSKHAGRSKSARHVQPASGAIPEADRNLLVMAAGGFHGIAAPSKQQTVWTWNSLA